MTVICFNSQGRAYWKNVPTKEYQKLHFTKECNYTTDDKQWFRKPLSVERNP